MDIPEDKFYRAKIVDRADFASDLWMIRVDPGGAFTFKPGQYATLGVQTEAKRIERAYSIVSSPIEPAIEFFFELVPQGELTPKLYALSQATKFSCASPPRACSRLTKRAAAPIISWCAL